jgi:hypothetical protein
MTATAQGDLRRSLLDGRSTASSRADAKPDWILWPSAIFDVLRLQVSRFSKRASG